MAGPVAYDDRTQPRCHIAMAFRMSPQAEIDGMFIAPLVAGRPLPIGRYELRFAIGKYFATEAAAVADPPFLDVVPVRFAIAEAEGSYHVPLVATPWSYATYRGS